MGSKNRISKNILPIMLDGRTDEYYVEPFVGGCNMIDKVEGKRIGSDNNEYLISMWKGLQKDKERPYKISKDIYSRSRTEYNKKVLNEFDSFMIGWIGWMGSYNGRFYDGGYSGHCVGKSERDYINEQIRNTEKQIEKIKGIYFNHCSYDELEMPNNSIIYCDIPYKGTKQYSTSKGFDHDHFWEWCRKMKSEDHKIFISEYNAPSDFKCVWEKEVTNSMNTSKTYKPIEKLFTI